MNANGAGSGKEPRKLTEQVMVLMSRDMVKALNAKAEKIDRSRAYVVREAVNQYLNKEGKGD